MKIRLDIALMFLLPIGYYVPALSWMATGLLWFTVLVMFIGCSILLWKYNELVEKYRAVDVLEPQFKFSFNTVLPMIISIVMAFFMGWQLAAMLLFASYVAFRCTIMEAWKDSREGRER
jgi:hypothetical protein